MGEGSHVVIGQKFPGEKGMRWCIVVIKQTVLLSSKFTVMSSQHFQAVTAKHHSGMQN
jgi:hypothetical protein